MQTGNPSAFGLFPGIRLIGFLRRPVKALAGLAVIAALALAVAALATWNVADPSFSHATARPPVNALGFAGAAFADLATQFLGLAATVALAPMAFWGLALLRDRPAASVAARFAAWGCGVILATAAFACLPAPQSWPLPSGLGGAVGDLVLQLPAKATGDVPSGLTAAALVLAIAPAASWLMLFGSLLTGARTGAPRAILREAQSDAQEYGNDERGSALSPAFGAAAHMWLAARAWLRRLGNRTREIRPGEVERPLDFDEEAVAALKGGERIDPVFDDPGNGLDDSLPATGQTAEPTVEARAPVRDRVAPAARRPVPAAGERRRQTDRTRKFRLPPLDLLAKPKNIVRDASLSADALEQNARMLEGVLEDFGVRGEIIQVRPGPVVTLYELEPAPGIKSSRVIGLADDIARSMSAIAARVAVVPGRNAIGIELPNRSRETVYLRELLASGEFAKTRARLPLSLGKTIGGEAVIADLAKMPHLLVAGTTGSGKSVAINTMILSILYRLTPERCRLIMIDPKMLELSVYDGIPHLLTPVVTDPKKAVVALKWTVREMEDRYRKMSKIGVRNIDGFNARIGEAAARGVQITRTVQTGFDRETGEAVYETEAFDLNPLPYIVVIIDEMADLMMVAGKDIEGAVQRLAQMARAAGIHVIMATQRPSVDIITGTIKANFPTRISFQVTSKIDSRTILGEQGADQLLGMGDMLYMAGGGRIQRVHGPFVTDGEVEEIVGFLKEQGVPEYTSAITEHSEEDASEPAAGGDETGGPDTSVGAGDPYDEAVAIVLRDGKASTSYIQRRLGIGYNRAATLIERMEEEGVIGPANHAGKREILARAGEEAL